LINEKETINDTDTIANSDNNDIEDEEVSDENNCLSFELGYN
jgi:hypothetical protein